jgi:SAM-dependent methyltransferase
MTDPETSRRSLLRGMSLIPAMSVVGAAAGAAGQAAAAVAVGDPIKVAAAVAGDGRQGGLVAPTGEAPRGKKGIYTRLDDLDLESYQDFLGGRGKWMGQMFAASQKRSEAVLLAHGIDPKKPSDRSLNDIVALLQDDPVIARVSRLGLDNHYDAFVRLRDHFHANGSYYGDKLAAAEKKGPGALELDAKLNVPDYTKHEIHNQVGGYMGDPFAGMIYFYGVNVLTDYANDQDYMYDAIVKNMPLPADGKVRRILDNGTGPGQLATSLKRRFPDAEVWGIDVSGPMVRYAHERANQMGVNVNFAQRLAEDNGFPDNYFDLITSTSFHHEVTQVASKKIFGEAQRVLRPGGIFRPAESGLNGYAPTPADKVHTYLSYRVNHEVWMMEWGELDRAGAMKDAGLKVDPNGAPGGNSGASWWLNSIKLVATKA